MPTIVKRTLLPYDDPTQTGAPNNFNNGGHNTKKFKSKKKGGSGGKGAPRRNRPGKGDGFSRKMTEGVMKGIVISSYSTIPIVGQYKKFS